MERVEKLKEEERWAFRQRKKFKGPAIPKSLWDYLLEEGAWLAIDFKEERRWKLATAYQLAMEVRRWHKASPEGKAEMSIGHRPWGQPRQVRTAEIEDRQGLQGEEETEAMPDTVMTTDEDGVDAVLNSIPDVAEEDSFESVPDAAALGQENTQKANSIMKDKLEDVEMPSADPPVFKGQGGDDSDEDADGEDDDEEDFVGDLKAIESKLSRARFVSYN